MKLLRKNLKYITNDGIKTEFNIGNKWSKFNTDEPYYLNDYEKKVTNKHLKENWFEFGKTEKVEVCIAFTYHPCPLLDWSPISFKEGVNASTSNNASLCYNPTTEYLKQFNLNENNCDFNCELLEPDVISVQVEIAPCVLLVYGTFLKRLWYVKEAYFSWDQAYSEIKNEFIQKMYNDIAPSLILVDKSDPRNFRPLSIDVTLAIHNIHGHLVLVIHFNSYQTIHLYNE